MNTTPYVFVGLLAIILIGIGGYMLFISPMQTEIPVATSTPVSTDVPLDALNASFTIEGQMVVLSHGISQTGTASSSSTLITTRYYGTETHGDLNADGREDTAFVVTQDLGKSAINFYAVVALKTSTGYQTTNAFKIGDRILPQNLVINSSAQELQVNFLERKSGEAASTTPTSPAVLVLKVTSDGKLTGVMQ